MHEPVIGIVPAAGKGTRLARSMCSKELLPVGEAASPAGHRPKAISEYLVDAMVGAGAGRVCMVIAPDKHDIVRFYGSGDAHGVPIAYVCQEVPTGMANAIDAAYPWLRGATVLMGMPDTIFTPADALAKLRMFYERERADLALAIFPTDEPDRLGPVQFDASGCVLEVMDKPEVAPHNKVWGVACWGSSLTDLLHDELSRRPPSQGELALGCLFQTAVERGLRVRALPFDDGIYVDAGTIEGLRAAQRVIATAPLAHVPT